MSKNVTLCRANSGHSGSEKLRRVEWRVIPTEEDLPLCKPSVYIIGQSGRSSPLGLVDCE